MNFNSMKLLLVFVCLLLAIRCHGNTTDNCTKFPTFINYSENSTAYHCYMYALPPTYYHQEIQMTVQVSPEDDINVTLIWYTQDGVLACHHMPCDNYVWGKDNKTLSWLNPNDSKVFYVNATNRCGGNATACFKVKPLCQPCNDCPVIPSPTNNSIKVAEDSDQTFDFSIKGEPYTIMKWCFVRSDHHNVCCYCNAESECPIADWTIDPRKDNCYHYTCSLTIRKVSMNYSDGTLISAVVGTNNTKNVNYTRILVTQDNDKQRSPLVSVCYTITGIGVIAAAVITITCMVYMIRRRRSWSSSYHMHNGYESIPSPSPLQKTAPIAINEDFCGDHNNDGFYGSNDDVRSCDLIMSTTPKNV